MNSTAITSDGLFQPVYLNMHGRACMPAHCYCLSLRHVLPCMLVLLTLCHCHRFSLKHVNTGMYLGVKKSTVTLVPQADADIYELERTGHANQDFIRVRTQDDMVWDISGSTGYLIYWNDPHGGYNQRFTVVTRPGEHVKVVNENSKCVTYNEVNGMFAPAQCNDDNQMQYFDYVERDGKDMERSAVVDRDDLEMFKEAALHCQVMRDILGEQFIRGLGSITGMSDGHV